MNPSIQLKTPTSLLLIVLALACFAIPPSAQAVVPPADGGYPGGNTAEGINALSSLTTGQYNTAVGLNALSSTTTGTFNTAIGSAALRNNTTSASNTAVGRNALFSNRFGDHNIAVGDSPLYYNTAGDFNTAVRDLAIRDKEGKPYSVRYNQVNAMLLKRVSQRTRDGAGARSDNHVSTERLRSGYCTTAEAN